MWFSVSEVPRPTFGRSGRGGGVVRLAVTEREEEVSELTCSMINSGRELTAFTKSRLLSFMKSQALMIGGWI